MARRTAPRSRHSRPPPTTQRLRRRLRAAAIADVEDGEEPCALSSHSWSAGSKSGGDKMFSLKKWNAVAMWSWDVECDTCAICRVQVMDACLRCQAENKQEDCVGMLSFCSPAFSTEGFLSVGMFEFAIMAFGFIMEIFSLPWWLRW